MITQQQAWAIGHLCHELRPEWEAEGVVAQVKRVADRNVVMVALACIRAAGDHDAKTPGVIPTNGTHWNDGIKAEPKPTYRPPMKHEDCRIHAGQWADGCSGCAADALAGDRTMAPDPRRPDAAEQRRAARDALTAVLDGLCRHGIDRRRAVCRECERAASETTEPSTEGASA